MLGHFHHSGVLFHHAKIAFQRISPDTVEEAPDRNDVLVAVLFSAATLEAWIAEIPVIFSGFLTELGPRIRAFMDVMDEVEESRGSIRLKYLLAKSVLTGESYDKGASPYQDFHLLFSIRDALLHMKSEKIGSDQSRTEKIVHALATRGLCVEKKEGVTSSWLSRICTREVACWSCNVVVDMVESICNGLSIHMKDSGFIDMLKHNFSYVKLDKTKMET